MRSADLPEARVPAGRTTEWLIPIFVIDEYDLT
jgi:hypothetical protein